MYRDTGAMVWPRYPSAGDFWINLLDEMYKGKKFRRALNA